MEGTMIVDKESKTLEQRVFDELEEQILSGKLSAGSRLVEQDISKRIGVSRTPVRGALQRLADEGLVDMNANRGAIVIGVSEEDLEDIYLIRMRLEGLASRMAAARISDENKQELQGSVELAEFYLEKNDAEHLKELDTAFHSIIYKASGNRLLCKILSELHRNIKAYRKRSLSNPERVRRSVAEHREILEAILSGNAGEADRLTSLHIERAMENLKRGSN